ncbi:transcriptional regulator [Sphingobium scionense]|jgi:predicted transcriptional regulator|uniref:Transcriptional regulator n=2 Tax=Sphingobium TaxID=165695 RepID=A0A562JPL9_SPHWJ|nr:MULTISPECIES: transcriptional regulator [Sphingobium]AMK26877.1 CopG family transcriptional regulator [Sphingobium sp. TKS]MCZ4344332.1 transcriptional regulator [Sphingomonadaceae bacterium G21617-S1]MBB4151578.1 putative transcriptional regulator [Sphingobium scionense]MBB6194027.1 putative transcriptional regulator [Sphingobium wenxiniae]TWH84925.1 hypothetical protein IQ35_04136 [Sphingobium wenxiniae]
MATMQERREAFKRDAVRAWEEYQATGLHATMEEVDKWLESWRTANELPRAYVTNRQ